MNLCIVGGGKLGYNLAKTMDQKGHSVTLVDNNHEKCRRLADELDMPVVYGDGTRLETQESSGAADCDVLIAVTGRDEDNLVACQIAHSEFGVNRTVARANNPKNIAIMKELGVNIVVSSTSIISHMIENEVETAAMHILASINRGEADINEFQVPLRWGRSGVQISELRLPETCVIISVMHNGRMEIPRGNTPIYAGDSVIMLVQDGDIKRIRKVFDV